MTDAISNNSLISDLTVEKKHAQKKESEELGQKAFLKLMITQLENQDPLSPQENTEFIAQLAQFSSVESLDNLNNKFENFSDNFVANQALQASSLVGRSVTVPTNTTILEPAGVVSAFADIPSSTNRVNINIYNDKGVLVDQIDAGAQSAGPFVLRWDGKYAEVNGEQLDWVSEHPDGVLPGKYRFSIEASLDGENTQLDTSLSANVNSVTVGANGNLTLNLAGIGAVGLADVKQFNE